MRAAWIHVMADMGRGERERKRENEREKGVEKFERSFGGVCPTLANGWDGKGEGI